MSEESKILSGLSLPGTYTRCMSGHYFAIVRGDEECPVCAALTALRRECDAAIEAGNVARSIVEESYREQTLRHAQELLALRVRRDQDAQIIQLIEHTVADDFCEDLDMRAEDLTGDAKVMHQKLSFLYRIAHSARGDAVCYGRHEDWRKEADEAIAAMQSVETPDQKGKTDESNR